MATAGDDEPQGSPEAGRADENAGGESLAAVARRLLQVQGRAALATLSTRDDGLQVAPRASAWPYTSLVQLAIAGQDAALVPLLLLSGLAEHTRNVRADPRLSLLLEDPLGSDDPLAHPRLTLIGRAEPSTDPGDKVRFVARHPSAALYAEFADFTMWRVQWSRAHLIAGFGRIRWLTHEEIAKA